MSNQTKASTLVLICMVILIILSQSEGTITYVRAEEQAEQVPVETFYAEVTAYTSTEEETDSDPLITASGETVGPGTIACPSRLKFGTKVRIENRIYTCNDRMNARYRQTNHFDIWLESKEKAYEWGRKTVQVSIILQDIHSFSAKID